MQARTLIPWLLLLLLMACEDEAPTVSQAVSFPESSLPGVYRGSFPCTNCPAIEATLWLQPSKVFFFKQKYLSTSEDQASSYGRGRWHWNELSQRLLLIGAGPVKTFERIGESELRMSTGSDLGYELIRVKQSLPFTDTLQLDGLIAEQGGRSTWTDCLTGLTLPVDKGGDYARFVRQYRDLVGSGVLTLAAIDGRLQWNAAGEPGSVVIDRMIMLKPNADC